MSMLEMEMEMEMVMIKVMVKVLNIKVWLFVAMLLTRLSPSSHAEPSSAESFD